MADTDTDIYFMRHAIGLARQAEQTGEVPVGAVLVQDGTIIGEGYNRVITDHDPTAHAEVVALRQAGKTLKNYRLPGTTLYVTLEPCTQCFGALVHARIHRLVFAASDPKAGALGGMIDLRIGTRFNHEIEVVAGTLADESADLLKNFFRARRKRLPGSCQSFISPEP
ncbi:MAG: tRNA adenosine(34) deaminase TadA [Gammaproteobacteria bacterium]|nr:MAG: tRNA adenosine(34) deaminase TadA [Gammaproteobacteria bacterium]